MAKYTLKEIVKSFYQKKNWEKQFPMNYYIVRPFSFLVTYFVISLTQSPSKVAIVGFILGLLGCFSFLGLYSWSVWPGVGLLFIFSLLDAVDGNIARTTGNVTHYGKFLDSVIGEIIEGSYFFGIALGLTISPFLTDSKTIDFPRDIKLLLPLICGTLIMAGRLYSSFIDMNYGQRALEKEAFKSLIKKGLHEQIQSSTFRKNWLYLIFINLNSLNNQIVLLIFCILIDKIVIFLYFFALYYLMRFTTYFLYFFFRARKQLK